MWLRNFRQRQNYFWGSLLGRIIALWLVEPRPDHMNIARAHAGSGRRISSPATSWHRWPSSKRLSPPVISFPPPVISTDPHSTLNSRTAASDSSPKHSARRSAVNARLCSRDTTLGMVATDISAPGIQPLLHGRTLAAVKRLAPFSTYAHMPGNHTGSRIFGCDIGREGGVRGS